MSFLQELRPGAGYTRGTVLVCSCSIAELTARNAHAEQELNYLRTPEFDSLGFFERYRVKFISGEVIMNTGEKLVIDIEEDACPESFSRAGTLVTAPYDSVLLCEGDLKHVRACNRCGLILKRSKQWSIGVDGRNNFLWKCPGFQCSVGWWDNSSATPADAKTRTARSTLRARLDASRADLDDDDLNRIDKVDRLVNRMTQSRGVGYLSQLVCESITERIDQIRGTSATVEREARIKVVEKASIYEAVVGKIVNAALAGFPATLEGLRQYEASLAANQKKARNFKFE